MKTSWQNVSSWYNENVGDRGHYYHEHVVLPGVMRFLAVKPGDSVLDLACGQGVLARRLPKGVSYTGIDIARSLIESAKQMDKNENHYYIVGDIARPIAPLLTQQFNSVAIQQPALPAGRFSHVTCILALQNVELPEMVIENAARHLFPNGNLVIVLNHPCFRIPRQSSWGVDEANKLQYRKVNRYMSPLKIPVTTHPGKSRSPVTWSFHRPISDYSAVLTKNKFVIEQLEEWTSDKESIGKAAKMENRGRAEFPLFLAIKARLL